MVMIPLNVGTRDVVVDVLVVPVVITTNQNQVAD